MQVHSSPSGATRAPGIASKKCGGTVIYFFVTLKHHFSLQITKLSLVSTNHCYPKTNYFLHFLPKTAPRVRSGFSVASFRILWKSLPPPHWPFWSTKKCWNWCANDTCKALTVNYCISIRSKSNNNVVFKISIKERQLISVLFALTLTLRAENHHALNKRKMS